MFLFDVHLGVFSWFLFVMGCFWLVLPLSLTRPIFILLFLEPFLLEFICWICIYINLSTFS